MDKQAVLERIKAIGNEERAEVKALVSARQQSAPLPERIDVYNVNRKAQEQERRTPRPNGAPSIVNKVAADAIRSRLARAYRRARDDSDRLKEQGEPERAKLVRDQYMQEQFLPVVESIIMFSSPDELLNATKALNALDALVLNEAGGRGYTASYVRTAYKNILGNSQDKSDPTVKQTVARIKLLADSANIRSCYGLAKRIKKQIDEGEHIASDEDYDIISRVAVFQ